MRSLELEQLRRLYRDYPDAYAADVLKARLTDDQLEILFSIVRHRRTRVKASHAIGKTFIAAVAACWWYDCWDEHIVYITAPTWPQCLGLTFKQIKLLRNQFNLPGKILETGRVEDLNPKRAPGHFIKALNAESGEGFQGEHTAPVFQIYEEAVGVPRYIWEAGDGLMTSPENRLLAVGNPTDDSTPFGQSCDSDLWRTLSISALNHPNVVAELKGEAPPFPKAVRLDWVCEMIVKECEGATVAEADAFEFPPGSGKWYLPNAVFQGRVLGDFPSQPDTQAIPRGWLNACGVKQPGTLPQIGLDVARFGTDRTVIAARSASCLMAIRIIRQMDLDFVVGATIDLLNDVAETLEFDARLMPIHVDVTGGLGAGPAVNLRNLGYTVVEVNSSSKAIEEERYPNKRSELWMHLRERVRTRDFDASRIPKDLRETLLRELTTPTWKPDSGGRKVVEPKEAIKKRLGASPDVADAVNLAYDGTPADFEDFAKRMAEAEAAKRAQYQDPAVRPDRPIRERREDVPSIFGR